MHFLPPAVHSASMTAPHQTNVTQLLVRVSGGDSAAGRELLPLVYEELRKLAQARMANEPAGGAGMTLQPTALVHEAYLRLVGPADVKWNSRGHFFGAAALAMRRILVERARSRKAAKRGGGAARADIDMDALSAESEPDTFLALDVAMEKLEKLDKRKYDVVMLRYYAGLGNEDTAAALGISTATVKNDWTFARAWLKRAMTEEGAA